MCHQIWCPASPRSDASIRLTMKLLTLENDYHSIVDKTDFMVKNDRIVVLGLVV